MHNDLIFNQIFYAVIKMKILVDSYNLVTQNKSGGIQVRIKRFYEEMSKNPKLYIKFFDRWNDKIEDFDVLHIFKISTENYAMIEYAKKKQVKVVISSILPKTSTLKTKLCNILEKFHIYTSDYFIKKGLQLSDQIIVQTQEEGEFVKKNYKISKNKINVIPNPINIDISNNNKELIFQKYNIPHEYILQVGRIDKNKNQLNVIKAVKDTQIPLVIIGGPDINSTEYFKKCKKEANNNVYFLGWIDHSDPLLASAYMNAKALILPSYNEIFGNVVIEGGIAGATLIVSDTIHFTRDEMFKGIIKFNPHSVAQIKKAIKLAYSKPKSSKFVKLISKEFSMESFINKHLDVYKK